MRLNLVHKTGGRIKGGDEILPAIIRQASIPFAQLLAAMKVRPEWVLTLSFFLSLIAAVCFAALRPVAGALFYFLSWFADFVDGDIARLTNKTTNRGAFFDSANGNFLNVIIYFGAAVGYWQIIGGAFPWVLAFLIIGAIYMFCVIKAKADSLDAKKKGKPTGLSHEGEFTDKSVLRHAVSFLLAGTDFLGVYIIVTGFLGRLDWLLMGSAVYGWGYVAFNLYHGLKRIQNEE